ncbi:MAG TPA: hypothetical protein VMM57_07155 [Bacteroidota bacterium]|nr:hypothetical protein [Bacteroidota bacterium]
MRSIPKTAGPPADAIRITGRVALSFALLSLLMIFCGCRKKVEEAVESHPSLDGFLDITWGDSPAQVKSKMLKKPGVEFASDSLDFEFTGGTFLGHTVDRWLFVFWRAKHLWYVRIIPEQDPQSIETLVVQLDDDLSTLYGKTEQPRTWRYLVEGETRTNDVRLIASQYSQVEVWFAGYGYLDSLQHALRPVRDEE